MARITTSWLKKYPHNYLNGFNLTSSLTYGKLNIMHAADMVCTFSLHVMQKGSVIKYTAGVIYVTTNVVKQSCIQNSPCQALAITIHSGAKLMQ